ncbi:MAG: superoxide dismutase [Cyanobacteria bacterium J06621_8]
MRYPKLFGWTLALVLMLFIFTGGLKPDKSMATTATITESATSRTILQPTNSLLAQASEEFTLPPLPYDYDALSTYIDQETMTVHHDKHHAGYVKNLNAAIADYPNLSGKSVEELLLDLDSLPSEIKSTVRNNGGGHANHTMFWSIMTPDSSAPSGELAEAITETFGDLDTFKDAFNTAGKKQFGSGWAWLVMNSTGALEVISTPNQDSPFLQGKYPIMGNDVWEHAYYLKYQNKRGDYLDAWWNVINWDEVNSRFLAAQEFMQ